MKKQYKEKIKQALIGKYGLRIANNFLDNWNSQKEDVFLSQLSTLIEDEGSAKEEWISGDAVIVNKLIARKNKLNNCKYCNKRTKNVDDDVCYNKYKTCYKCYILQIEGKDNENF